MMLHLGEIIEPWFKERSYANSSIIISLSDITTKNISGGNLKDEWNIEYVKSEKNKTGIIEQSQDIIELHSSMNLNSLPRNTASNLRDYWNL